MAPTALVQQSDSEWCVMQNNRTNTRTMWLIVLSAVLFFGVAVVTLRAAERAVQAGPPSSSAAHGKTGVVPGPPGDPGKQLPPPSAPEESATITDDPTTAPDPKQSADNNVSFPTNI